MTATLTSASVLTPVDPATLFVALGADSGMRWHQRLVQAADEATVRRWWQQQIQVPPLLVVALPALDTAIAAALTVAQAHGHASVWGGWVERGDGPVQLVAVTADNRDDAQAGVQAQLGDGDRLLCVVDLWPWLDVLARLRAIAAGTLAPDERLRGRG